MTTSAHADILAAMEYSAQLFKALGDVTRLRILALLFSGELCVCDITEIMDLPQSTVSRHLCTLRNVGLVKSKRKQKWMHYRIPSNSDGLIYNSIKLLKQQLPLLSTIREDRMRLEKYLMEKNAQRCRQSSKQH